jgi:hypothetical protein
MKNHNKKKLESKCEIKSKVTTNDPESKNMQHKKEISHETLCSNNIQIKAKVMT